MRQMRENVLRKLACKQAFSTDAIWRSATSRWRMLRIRNRDACWTGIMSVSSLKNHWSLNCSLLLFRFELRSLPWILPPTSLASGPEISIELNVRGCFVIQLSTFFTELRSALLLLNCKSFYILSHLLLFVKHFFFLFSIKIQKKMCFSKLISLHLLSM